MKIPLIGVCSPYTRNIETGEMQSIVWRDGEKEVHKAPYEPYVYVQDHETGSPYRITGKEGSILLRKEHYRAGEELSRALILDGGRENIMERLLIEHPDYFLQYPHKDELKVLCFDIETTSADGSFPFGPQHPVTAIGVTTNTGEREVFLWDGKDDQKFSAISQGL